jgi:hypothetical protein
VRRNPVALVDHPLFPELFNRPPDGLDIFVFHGDVGFLEVDPESDSLGYLLEFSDVAEDALAAEGVELLDAVSLYLFFAGKAELLFHIKLYGEPVSIPPGDTGRIITLHRFKTRDYVLYDSRHDCMNAGAAVSGRRTLVKVESRAAFPVFDAFFESLLFFPHPQDVFFHLRKIRFTAYRFKHESSSLDCIYKKNLVL